ncbi:MAG: GIY-YIG nuclease family protein [Candidatus Kerfeldbacteria bacterium]|nr:GIY-YIG nuclease family protein [Candidatus Kerfeldbacteria bacterium]
MDNRVYATYIMANWNNKVLYVGSTAIFPERIDQHRKKLVDGFTKKYQVNKLVFYEMGDDLQSVRQREWQVKRWRRAKKVQLIESMNPGWKDLYPNLMNNM